MIEVVSPASGSGARFTLRPPRALTARQFVGLFAALAGAMWLVALLGWWGGNAFAPAFALFDSALVAVALRWLWRQGQRAETVVFTQDAVEVWRAGQARPVFRAHPYWVRLEGGDEADPVCLASSGRRCEVGAFLGPDERRQLRHSLRALLAACH
ncbi:DUF2244 domain-containing protein [Vulcaniibacterium gelatinicum]|uniref:DUF2244 domain-containing protein n=1 Tax=Vulcaniibacterium gelatinicum TaxID=2598725 RepID=UPI0011CCC97D|nr:DUF2244 domain-containing protein [Vulcaniibacterium gelatinicum]